MIAEATLTAMATAGVFAWGVRHPASQLFAPSVHRGPAARPWIALTFDDGPSESTPRLLELLERRRARATFFQCGHHARRLPHIAREVAGAGHEIGNHTDTHPYLMFKTAAFMEREILKAQQSIADAAGLQPRLFRPPYGARWPGLGGVQRRSIGAWTAQRWWSG
jgi:peptidoglycan-N-acetylglucosamine deacetylase